MTDGDRADAPENRNIPKTPVNPTVALTQATVVDAIVREMQAHPPINGWVPAAENALIASGDEYVRAVGVAAVRLARKRAATVVDAMDVQTAVDGLLQPGDAWSSWLLAMASLLGGAAAAAVITIFAAPEPPSHALFWYAGIATLSFATVILLWIGRPRRARSRRS
jgi:hypothetical protein